MRLCRQIGETVEKLDLPPVSLETPAAMAAGGNAFARAIAGETVFCRIAHLAAAKAVELALRHDIDPAQILERFTAEWPSMPAGQSLGFILAVEKHNRAIVEQHRLLVEKQRPPERDRVRSGGPAGARRAHGKRKKKGGRRR